MTGSLRNIEGWAPSVVPARFLLVARFLTGLLLALAIPSPTWGQSSWQLQSTITEPSVRQPDWQNPNVATDYLALVLSWSPEHCAQQTTTAKRAKHAFHCQLNRFEFVVHGLWPQSQQAQSAQDHPRHCESSGSLPVDLLKRHLCSVPGTDLMQNEWHGDDGTNNAEVACGAAPKDGQRFRAMRMKLN